MTRWVQIPGYSTYRISDDGEVRNATDKKVASDGYRVTLSENGVKTRINIKRTTQLVFPDLAETALNKEGELWKPIPEHAGYEISNLLRVRRSASTTPHGRHGIMRMIAAKVLKPAKINGYLVAYLGSKSARVYVEKVASQLFPKPTELPSGPPEERWSDIVGYEGLYKISNLGRVFSLPRIINDGKGRNRYIRARIRENGSDINGYPKVELAKEGNTRTLLLHRLVAQAFVPNPSNLSHVHHRDEVKTNARWDNLEWISAAGNIQDWFGAREHRVDATLIGQIAISLASGMTPEEILGSLAKTKK